ncbi:hypothetical protein TcG_05496 [Trypanosoma cruzi]|uniref:Uncharacterized protein n=1 Tax=Trypanosoma cruzi TaxID=5693 RepID=A0A2V2VNH4_TRYCR|nr:hypothetical protein TcBrA4_0122060 [Trypanosoma cruzi]PBJ70069.1 hypothetical protein BCY84_19092 [Trypanosoma cruzi cruzi]PBJ79118.1 hypothetical protein BCY84_03335 [Trypanosoma cruzi cruzi]PWU95883.1 hypothetical protein C4B63_20g1417c [Trypanosoma cruzi]RNF17587.1 hypothetical protein TcG_05496 [Trypanosoma cruzi]
MGQSNSWALASDTIKGEQYRAYHAARQNIVHRAFQKCVAPSSTEVSDFNLTKDEQTCVEEFALLYAAFAKNGFAQLSQLYEQHQREMYEKARLEMMAQQARKELRH